MHEYFFRVTPRSGPHRDRRVFVEDYLKELRRDRYSPRAVATYVARCARMSVQAALERPKALTGVLLAGFGHVIFLFSVAVAISFLVDRPLAVEYLVLSAWWLLGGLAWITLHLGMFRRDEDLPISGLAVEVRFQG